MAKRKLVIDCDAGIDDAQAILLALSHEDVEILAITCVAGNVPLDNVCVNVFKVLELCERTDIPVYKGAPGPLVGKKLTQTWERFPYKPNISYAYGSKIWNKSRNNGTPKEKQ